jgi:nicotinamide riboside transporter PnuC
MKIFGREPAVILATVSALIQFLSLFIVELTTDQQAVLNAVVAALIGVITAATVARDKLLPAVVGLGQAILALAVGFGADWSAEQQTALMALVATAAGMFIRTQVAAPVNEVGQLRGRHYNGDIAA